MKKHFLCQSLHCCAKFPQKKPYPPTVQVRDRHGPLLPAGVGREPLRRVRPHHVPGLRRLPPPPRVQLRPGGELCRGARLRPGEALLNVPGGHGLPRSGGGGPWRGQPAGALHTQG